MVIAGVYLVGTIPSDLLGTLPGWLTLCAIVTAAWSFRKGGGGIAIASLEAAGRVMEKRIHEQDKEIAKQEHEIAQLRGEIAQLRSRTDIASALQPLMEMIATHEGQAAERHEQMLIVMDLMAQRLGPDHNGQETS